MPNRNKSGSQKVVTRCLVKRECSVGSIGPEKSVVSLAATLPQNKDEAHCSFILQDDLEKENLDQWEYHDHMEGDYFPSQSLRGSHRSSTQSSKTRDLSTYFADGRRPVDYVLVYEESRKDLKAGIPVRGHLNDSLKDFKDEVTAQEVLENWTNSSGGKSIKQRICRRRFLASLAKIGIEMEEEIEEGGRKIVGFIKLTAPWSVLCHYAEKLSLRAPLQVHNNPATNWSEDLLEKIKIPNIMSQEVPNQPKDYYTCAFKRSKIHRFLGSENKETYFTNTQRSQILHEILSTSLYGKRKKGEIGIERLIREGVFTAAFPLHDGPYDCSIEDDKAKLNPRQILYCYWARYSKWYKYQPLDHIRDYFGEKVGIYFAWLGLYTGWLLPASIVGLLVFSYGVITINRNTPANEICERRGQFKMCPLCDESLGCKTWDLNDICANAKISYLFDHPGTVFYAIFISFWAVSFLEYWKRKSASLAHHWDCLDFQKEEERPRPEFAAKAPYFERNPVTGVREPYFPPFQRSKRIIFGVGVIFVMMTLVMIFIVAVIIYRVLVSIPLFQNESLRSQAQTISSLSGAVVNFIFIMVLGRVYEKLAYRLTQWEMHRTQAEFEDSLTFKVFIFQFVNFYSSIFYIAFFKGRFVGYPGHYHHIFGLRNEDCSAGGCLIELAQQLAVIMIGKQIVNNAQEILVPKLKGWWHKKKVRLRGSERRRWEADYELIENEGLFQEYLEMVLQFGFITIFVAAFPLAPLFALLNNWVEIRLDAKKFVCETRRPVTERAQNIGIWFTILHCMAHLAVISNGFLIAFTSDFIPRIIFKYEHNWDLKGYVNSTLAMAPKGSISQECRYRGYRNENGEHTLFFWRLLAIRFGFVILFEHVVFGICRLIDIVVPDVPGSLEIQIKRERYLARQALADSDTILKVAQNHKGSEDLQDFMTSSKSQRESLLSTKEEVTTVNRTKTTEYTHHPEELKPSNNNNSKSKMLTENKDISKKEFANMHSSCTSTSLNLEGLNSFNDAISTLRELKRFSYCDMPPPKYKSIREPVSDREISSDDEDASDEIYPSYQLMISPNDHEITTPFDSNSDCQDCKYLQGPNCGEPAAISYCRKHGNAYSTMIELRN